MRERRCPHDQIVLDVLGVERGPDGQPVRARWACSFCGRKYTAEVDDGPRSRPRVRPMVSRWNGR